EDMATKFFEHFLYIAKAMTNVADAGIGLWDERDQFFYDVLQLPDGQRIPLEYRSMVGLTPLFAVEVLSPEILERLPQFKRHMEWFLNHRPDLAELVSHWDQPGRGETRLLSLLRGHRMKKLLERMLDETEFLAPHGVRSLSKVHEDHPYIFRSADGEHVVRYRPAESDTGLFGGNSNWRGPIWFPVCYLLIESLRRFHGYYGDDFKIECPTHSGKWVTIRQAADEVAARMTQIFLRDARGRRAVFGANERLQNDPHFRDYLQFHEYFSGDDGRGLGAAHQTGWTGLIATLLRPSAAAQPAVAPPGAAAQKEPAP
ncbi:MAG: MGH1-like glycoside hydrolase domain-containing protein, partial [Planctomycetota bacterium]